MSDVADLYAALGVHPSAPHAVVQQAYRTIMRTAHPDVAGTDPDAAERAVAANAAWSVLRDPAARARYDRQRMEAARGAANAADAGLQPADGAVPSWGVGGVRPVTVAQLREAAARESAYSRLRRDQRDAFSAASLRVGVAIVVVGMLLLAIVALR